MPMNPPAFTKDPKRISRLQANYDEGVQRERIPAKLREQLDLECLQMTQKKLIFLFQNAMEGYTVDVKNEKVKEFNRVNETATEKSCRRFLAA